MTIINKSLEVFGGMIKYPNIEDISNVLDHMENLSSSERTHLAAVFENIKNRQEELFENLKKEIKDELQYNEQEKIDIYTTLVEADMRRQLKEYNFFEMCEGINILEKEKITIKNSVISGSENYFCGIVFWKDKYELMSDKTSKNYRAKVKINDESYEAIYFFRNTDIFVDMEKNIHRIAIQYGIEVPIIYNPMARRAMELFIKLPYNVTKEDTINIDFCFEENELRNTLLLNNYLLWNISLKGNDELSEPRTGEYKEILPLWDYTFLTYKFLLKNKNQNIKDFLLIKNDLRIIKRIGDEVYWQLKDSYTEMQYEKYSIYALGTVVEKRLESQNKYFYHNKYEFPALGIIERIRTKADAMRVVAGFKGLGIKCKSVFSGNDYDGTNVIYTYPKRMDYYQIKDDRLRSARICKVKFDINEDDSMYIDKISYVISFLNYRYPEYRWIGVN